jgi:hypothetical protein
MKLQIGWCNRCEVLCWGPTDKIAHCPRCKKKDDVDRANLSEKASRIFARMLVKMAEDNQLEEEKKND